MGGRGAYTQGKANGYTYETIDTYEGVKILRGMPGTGLHDLPEEAHSSNAYISLHPNGSVRTSGLCNFRTSMRSSEWN